jgi:uncharacterized Fe-S cluster-containing radical SAM superfamily protein
METLIAYCGLDCGSCLIHLATLEQDKILQYAMRKSVAEQLFKYYGINSSPENINDCDGCRADTGRIYTGCIQCDIRKCAITKNLESCVFCDNYSCDNLRKHFSLDHEAKERLEEIRKTNNNNYLEIKE